MVKHLSPSNFFNWLFVELVCQLYVSLSLLNSDLTTRSRKKSETNINDQKWHCNLKDVQFKEHRKYPQKETENASVCVNNTRSKTKINIHNLKFWSCKTAIVRFIFHLAFISRRKWQRGKLCSVSTK